VSTLASSLPLFLGGDAALAKSFADLSLAVQQQGQWENSADITPEVLLQAINFGLIEGYDIMVQRWLDYYTLDTTFELLSSTTTYSLSGFATGFYKLRHCDYSQDTLPTATSRWTRMLPFDLSAQYAYSGTTATAGRAPRYRLQGQNLVLAQPVSGSVRMYYIPGAPQFLSTDDTSLVLFDAPVEEMLVVAIAQREILERNDLPIVDVERKIVRYENKLRVAGDDRDAGEPIYLNPYGPKRDFLVGGPDDDAWWP